MEVCSEYLFLSFSDFKLNPKLDMRNMLVYPEVFQSIISAGLFPFSGSGGNGSERYTEVKENYWSRQPRQSKQHCASEWGKGHLEGPCVEP